MKAGIVLGGILCGVAIISAHGQTVQTNLAVTVQHAPSLNGGTIQGSVQQLNGESVTLNGGLAVSGDLLVPGTPTLHVNGNPTWSGTLAGSGSASPSGYQVTLNGNAALRYLRTRTIPVTLPGVSAPALPVGTRAVNLNSAGQSYGDAGTLRDLTLNGNVGLVAVPPGTYGNFTVNGGSGLVLGVAGGLQAINYNLQNLNLNGNATLKIVGPVVLTVANGLTANGTVGTSNNPAWLQLRVANGGLTLNGGSAVCGQVLAPNGSVIVNGNATLLGTCASAQFTLNGSGVVRWGGGAAQTNQPPSATAQSITLAENSSTNLTLGGSDPQGGTLAFTLVTTPTHGAVSGTPPSVTYTPATNYFGGDAFSFKVNNGLTDSLPATVSLTVTQVYYPPTAFAQSLTNLEDTALPVTLTGADPQGYALTFAVLTPPAHGALSGTVPSLVYLPATNYFGNDAFTFQAGDGVSNSSPATISITNQPVDEPPVVVAGANQVIILPVNTVTLAGSVAYDVFPGTVDTVQWSQVSGPGSVAFGNAANALTTATFSQSGIYQLRLFASDSVLSGSDELCVTVDAPPVVSAGQAMTNTFPGTITLAGWASDEGLPTNGTLRVAWSEVSGPGTVVFGNGATTNSPATFGASGVYVLRLTADDGLATNQAEVTVVENLPPVVEAGASILTNGLQAALNGSMSDDGLPGGFLAGQWTQASGPGTVTFGDASATNTSVTASQSGTYVLTLSATDGAATNASEVTVTFNLPPGVDAGPAQVVNFGTPVALAGAVTDDQLPYNTLTCAWVEVSGPGSATFADASQTNTTVSFDQPGSYTLSLIASDGWAITNAEVVIELNAAPVVDAGTDQTVTLGTPATLAGSYTDDGIPGPAVATLWSELSGPAGAGFSDPTVLNPSVAFSQSGTYVLQLTADDGLTNGSAQVTITVLPATPGSTPPVAQAQSLTLWEDGSLSILLTGTDAGNNPLAFQVLTQPANGTLSGAAPNLVYQPAAGFIGTDSFTFSVNDGTMDSAPATVQVAVAQVVVAPGVFAGKSHVLVQTNVAGLKGQAVGYNAALGGALTAGWSVVSEPAGASVSFSDAHNPQATATFSGPGAYQLSLVADDGLTNMAASVYFWVFDTLPPEPGLVAPPLDRTEPTCLGNSVVFLYTNNPPIQQGVASGTIGFERTAVLRGRVLDQAGNPLGGVGVTVLGRPELGATVTRTNGWYDLVVNGGAPLTLNFEKPGLIASQRQSEAPWQKSMVLPDVALVALDQNANTIYPNAGGAQVATGGVMTDADGSRQAAVMFPAGTYAQLQFGGVVSAPLASMTVRATEFTVGTNGPSAMPAELPPSSGYSYCVELSLDEAVAAEADTVRFNQPVSFYVENFIGFPAGMKMPVGFYDRQRGCWVPSQNGRVVTILALAGGQAVLDVDGSGSPASQGQLDELGITAGELSWLNGRYAAGQSLTRAQTSHFTAFDLNPCHTEDKELLDQLSQIVVPAPNVPKANPDQITDKDCPQIAGSEIGAQSQVLGESVGVAGTPFSLHYGSDRVPGRIAARQLQIPIRGGGELLYGPDIMVEVFVAGQEWQETLPYAGTFPGETVTFTWDGRDAYGRVLQGPQMATVRIGYQYKMYYVDFAALPDEPLAELFMQLGATALPFQSAITRGEAPPQVLWETYEAPVEIQDARASGLGGWTLNQQHTYFPMSRTLILGDGSRRSALSVNAAVKNLSSGPVDFVAAAADGSIVFSVRGDGVGENTQIQRRAPDGTITVIAGGGSAAPANGSLATEARLDGVAGVMVAPDGSVYFANTGYIYFGGDYRIWRIGADGRLGAIAGNGTRGYSGDGGPATGASLNFFYLFYGADIRRPDDTAGQLAANSTAEAGVIDPVEMAVSPDGTLYFIDYYNRALRRVGNDGIIATVAGGYASDTTDNIPANQAALSYPSGLAITSEGDVYIGDNQGLHRITRDGIMSLVGNFDPVNALALAPNHSLYVESWDAVSGSQHIDELRPDGQVGRVAGTDDGSGSAVDGVGALDFPIYADNGSLAAGPDNTLYFCAQGLWHISPPLPGLSQQDIALPSEDGSQLYYFTGTGKHLRTVDALTGNTLLGFGYDRTGSLATITDLDGDVTTIERDETDQATAIVSADGHRTTLGYDANGWLNRIANPAGEACSMTYTADGLLTQFTNPRQNSSTITYDAAGRLQRDANAAGGSTTLGRTDYTNGVKVSVVTGMNYQPASYMVQQIVGATDVLSYEYHENVAPDGSTNRVWAGKNGTTTAVGADGTTTSTQDGPDPRWGLQAPFTAASTVTLPSGNQLTAARSRSVVLADANDPLSLVGQTDTVTVNGLTATATYTFDGVNRVVTSSSPLGRTAAATLDGKGRVVQAAVPEVAPVNYQYDGRGRLVTVSQTGDGQTRTVGLTYDTTQNGGAASGRLTGITDVLGNTTTFTYDPGLSGRVVQETFANGRYLQYQYDANGNLTGVTPPQKPTHWFAFDAVDLLAQYTPPSAPNTGNDFTTYAYNLNKQITTVTRPDGLQINCAYDPGIGWLTNVSLPLGESVAYTYVQNGCGCSGVGRPQSLTFHAVDYTSAINYTYDSSLVTGVAWSGPVAGTVNAGYDNFFRVNALSVNGGSAVGFGYDADGLLVQAGDLALTRDPQNGRLAGTTLGNVSDAWAYTGFGEAQSYTATAGGNVLYAMSFTRDSAGRIATRTETIGGVTSVYGYGYDPVRGWLTDVTKNGVAAGHYAYDDNGNRTSLVTQDRAVDYAAADGQDRIASATLTLPLQVPQNLSWTYSANGEVQSKTVGASTTSYSYDVRGSLRDVTLTNGVRIEYVVDAAGRRIGKEVNGSLTAGWLYQDGLKPAAELDGAGNVVSLFVYGGKANVPEYLVRSGNEYRLITDQLGSVRLVVNAVDGTVAQEMDYDEFGRVLNDSNPGFQPFGFAGGLYDPDTKLVRFGARDYDAASGRWMSRDPIGERGGLNLYGYAHNRPVDTVDPFGLLTPEEIGILQAQASGQSQLINQQKQLIESLNATVKFWEASANAAAGPDKGWCTTGYNQAKAALANANAELRQLEAQYRETMRLLAGAGGATAAAAGGLYATATEVFTAPTVGASFTGSGVTGGAIAGGAVVGAAALGAGIGYGASQIPVIGGGNVADFWGDVLYNACPSCFH